MPSQPGMRPRYHGHLVEAIETLDHLTFKGIPMKLFSFRNRKPAALRRGTTHRYQPQVESLEERQLMAANLYVDFGFGFAGGSLNVSDAQMATVGVNGPQVFGDSHNIISLTRSIQDLRIDVNGDGKFGTGVAARSRCFDPVIVVDPEMIVKVASNCVSVPVWKPKEPCTGFGEGGTTAPVIGPTVAVNSSV